MGTLQDSNVCRLCATDSEDGFLLFGQNGNEKICTLINKYLPIEIKKDEKLPKKICSECEISLQNVVQFVNSIIRGQKILLEKVSQEENYQRTFEWKKSQSCQIPHMQTDSTPESSNVESYVIENHQVKPQENQIDVQNDVNFTNRKCKICEKYPRNLKIHKFLAHNIGDNLKTFICDACGEKFCHRNSIIYHIRSKHGENLFYNCNKCGKEFASSRLLNRHFKRIHTVVRLFECIRCHATFTAEDDLEAHLQSCCTRSTFTCEVCKKTCQFGDAHKCGKDKKSAKEYRCGICDKTFPYSSNLYRHQKLHSNERPFQCTTCSRKFPTLSRLNMHENEHKKEYSYKCDVCEKSFVNNRILQIHSRRHTRIFPFQCDVCCKGFPDKSTLVKHTRVHTGERPYRCDLCGKSFADQSNFLRHKKGHHKENPVKLSKNSQVVKKTNLPSKPRMEIDLSSMTYNDVEYKEKSHIPPKPIPLTNHLPPFPAKLSKMNILEKAIENVIHEYDNPPEKQLTANFEPSKIDQTKKCIYYDNTAKQFLLLDSARTEKNVLLIPPLLLDPSTKAPQNEEKIPNPLVLKSTKSPNSYVIVKKANTPLTDNAKVIVIRNANKSKILMQRPIKNCKNLLNSSLEDGSFDNDGYEIENKSDQLPELYSYEEMAPSPTSSEYIDVEDLVATFTPNISFEEIGDLNDLVNAKIDL